MRIERFRSRRRNEPLPCSPSMASSTTDRASGLPLSQRQESSPEKQADKLPILRENACNGVHVENLIDEYVSTVEDVNEILMKGLSNRKVGTTSMNLKRVAHQMASTAHGLAELPLLILLVLIMMNLMVAASTVQEKKDKKPLKLINILSEAPETKKDDSPQVILFDA
uniref:Uncharacterized protein n=2 Tax=Oryza TaxID=4527 RepID=A0A0E0F741_9ORYZ